jgi:hypothetical protein
MTLNEFAKKWNVSKQKARQMCPYIEGATQCPLCHGWEIPDNAVAIYIPHKQHYKAKFRRHCYVLDAISLGMLLVEELSLISESDCQAIVMQLKNANLIALKPDCGMDSLNYKDYILQIPDNWDSQNSSEKVQIVIEALKTVQALATTVTAIVNRMPEAV